jgi:hypothetical protein
MLGKVPLLCCNSVVLSMTDVLLLQCINGQLLAPAPIAACLLCHVTDCYPVISSMSIVWLPTGICLQHAASSCISANNAHEDAEQRCVHGLCGIIHIYG